MANPVTDPDLLRELESQSVSDPALLAQLEGEDSDIPGPMMTPEQATAAEAARASRPMTEKLIEGLRQNFLMGGATDIRNMLGAITPGAGPQLGAPGAFTSAVPAIRESMGFAARAPTVRQSTLANARGAGYVVPPSMPDSKAGLFTRILEGIVGKANTQQVASIRNQEVTNRLANQALGLGGDVQLTPEVLENVRKTAGKAYEAVKAVPGKFAADAQYLDDLAKIETPFSAAAREFPAAGVDPAARKVVSSVLENEASPRAIIELVGKLRADAKKGFAAMNNPEAVAEAHAQWGAAKALEGLVERNLERIGKVDLLDAFRAARTQIAKTHDLEKALNIGSADISAARIAARAGKSPMTGELSTIAKFRTAYPKAAQDVAQIGSMPLGSPLDAAAGAIVGGVTGQPGMGIATAMARPAGRKLMEALVLSGQQPGTWSKLDSNARMQILANAVRGGQLGYNEAMKLMAIEGVEE